MAELESERPISECIELISRILNFNESSFDYEIQTNWEYLYFRTQGYRVDRVILKHIFRNTKMVLIEIECIQGLTEICFGRPLESKPLDGK